MSEAEHPEPPRPSVASRLMKFAAAVVVAGLLVVGAKAIAKGDSASANGAAGTQPTRTTSYPESAPPSGMRPGMGAAVTGATLDRLTSLVTARYPGTIERTDRLPDGSYVVHVIRGNGEELHVHVSKDFTITGTGQDGPGRFGHQDGSAPDGPPAGNPS